MSIDGIFLSDVSKQKIKYKALKWIHQHLSSECSMSPRMLAGAFLFA